MPFFHIKYLSSFFFFFLKKKSNLFTAILYDKEADCENESLGNVFNTNLEFG